jgi:hypothetical protein
MYGSKFASATKPAKATADKPPQPTFGKIKFEGKDLPPQPATYDQIAISDKHELMYVSCVAEANFIKAIRAILGGGAKAGITATGGKVKVPTNPFAVPADPDKVTKSEEGYDCYTHKLEHGLVHAVFVSRKPGFMLNVSDEALAVELSDTRYTTPFLREWVPYIKEQFLKGGLLAMCSSFNCSCGIMEATEKQFDFVVSNGLKQRHLIIPGA